MQPVTCHMSYATCNPVEGVLSTGQEEDNDRYVSLGQNCKGKFNSKANIAQIAIQS